MDKVKNLLSSNKNQTTDSSTNRMDNKNESMPGSFQDDDVNQTSSRSTGTGHHDNLASGTSSGVSQSQAQSALSAAKTTPSSTGQTGTGTGNFAASDPTSATHSSSAAPRIPEQDFGSNVSHSTGLASGTTGTMASTGITSHSPYLQDNAAAGGSTASIKSGHVGQAQDSSLMSSSAGTAYDGTPTSANTAGGTSVAGAGLGHDSTMDGASGMHSGLGATGHNAALGSTGSGLAGTGVASTSHGRDTQPGMSAAGSTASVGQTTTDRTFPLGGHHIPGPHHTTTANILDPHVGNTSATGIASTHDVPGGTSGSPAHQIGLASGTGVAAGTTGLASNTRGVHTGIAPDTTTSSQHYDALSTGTPSGLSSHDPANPHYSGIGSESHVGRNAALGAGAGTATGVAGGEALKHGMQHHNDAAGTTSNPMTSHTDTGIGSTVNKDHSSSHTGRDAALVGGGAGAGTAALAAHEHNKHDPHVSHDAGKTTHDNKHSTTKPEKESIGTKIKSALGIGSTKEKEHGHHGDTLAEDERHKTDASAYPKGRDAALNTDHPDKHHHARDTAVGTGAGAAGVGAAGSVANEWRGEKGTGEAVDPNFTGPASKTLGPHSSNFANVMDPRVLPEPGMMKDHTTVGPHQSDTMNKMDPRVKHDPAHPSNQGMGLAGSDSNTTSHADRDAALAAGATGAGAGTYGASHAGTDRYDHLASGNPSGISQHDPAYSQVSNTTGTTSHNTTNTSASPYDTSASMGTDARPHNIATTEEKGKSSHGIASVLHRDNPNKLHKDPKSAIGTDAETGARTTHEAQVAQAGATGSGKHMGTDGQIGNM